MKIAFHGRCSAVALTTVAIVSAQRARPAPTMEVYKSPTCGCCTKWVEHVRQAGFTVKVTELDDQALDALKTKHGVPRTAQSCHTGARRRLRRRRARAGGGSSAGCSRKSRRSPGIAVGGMPTGSPGMEVAGVAAAAPTTSSPSTSRARSASTRRRIR